MGHSERDINKSEHLGEVVSCRRLTEATELNENKEAAWRSKKHLGCRLEQQHLKGQGKPLKPTGDPGKDRMQQAEETHEQHLT